MKARLSVRLFISYLAVAAAGAFVSYLTVRLLATHLFDQRMSMMDGSGSDGMGMGMGMGGGFRSRMDAIFLPVLDNSLLVGLLASAVVAVAAGLLVTRRLLRPLDAVRRATRRIAAGRYDGAVPLPAEPELAALAADVNTLALTLADTESRRTRLLGEVAHEMRTPLTALDGYVEGMIDGVFPADADTLASLSEELRRLHRLADDLSGLSRAQEQRFDLHPVDTDLADLARRAATRLAPQFEDAGVRLTVTAGTALPARADPDRIMQVLTNLLGNALLATPPGGSVTVTARATAGTANGTGAGTGEITVTDTGVGLAPEDVERVFERFYRAPGQTRRSAGSGVGLTIARGLARGHGGDVTASSPGRGRGASFTLSLPLLPPRE